VPHAYLSIGSNLDGPIERVRAAVEELRGAGMVTAVSPFYRSTPWGPVRDQPDFINAVVALETHLKPRELLAYVKEAERRAGRAEHGERWGPRRIDLDILTYDELRLDDPDLVIPHPRMNERAFVLFPLADLDEAYARTRDALPESERRSVTKIAR
jgi:2-amino-4-hydroxy-6-hydroxymethyldihydropteridine diphosphokinase